MKFHVYNNLVVNIENTTYKIPVFSSGLKSRVEKGRNTIGNEEKKTQFFKSIINNNSNIEKITDLFYKTYSHNTKHILNVCTNFILM